MCEYILQMQNITKEFSGVKALSDVSFSVKKGEIHALAGENGAGKSTLMKVLSGTYPNGTYSGKILLDEEERRFSGVKDSEKAGIAIIFQELTVIKSMSICENIFLGDEIVVNGVIQWNEQIKRTKELLQKVRLEVDPETRVGELGVGKQQLVEIAKALNKKAKLLILDEPTSSLTDVDTRNLLEIIRELKSEGTTCVYISHKLNEIFEIADTVTVIRDGAAIVTEKIADLTESKIVSYMVGRELTQLFPHEDHRSGNCVLELRNWSVPNPDMPGKRLVNQVNLHADAGEIVGIAGLMGAGRTELALSIFGCLETTKESEMYMGGTRVKLTDPGKAIANGIAYVSEDRKRFGLILDSDIQSNMSLASLRKLCKYGVINENAETRQAQEYIKRLRIKASSVLQKTRNLSGGNQQKVILGKWMLTNPKVLILDEPTRGIDVGAKREIYQEMNELVKRGFCIIMISSEMPEIIGMSDRIYVMSEGRITGEFNREEATQEKILTFAIGGN